MFSNVSVYCHQTVAENDFKLNHFDHHKEDQRKLEVFAAFQIDRSRFMHFLHFGYGLTS